MTKFKFMRLITLLGIVLISILCISCGCKEEYCSVEPSSTASKPVVQKTTQSFGDLKIDDGFTFENQRVVDVDFRFSQKQTLTNISLFSGLEPETGTPIKLLEQAELHNAIKFRSSLVVPSYVKSLVVVVSGDFLGELELPIDENNRIHYLFE